MTLRDHVFVYMDIQCQIVSDSWHDLMYFNTQYILYLQINRDCVNQENQSGIHRIF